MLYKKYTCDDTLVARDRGSKLETFKRKTNNRLIPKNIQMKQYINKLLITALGSVIIAGCADTGIDDFSVEKPNTIAGMEYLNDYSPLKSYIDRTTHPNFKLGSGVSESDFNQGGLVYRLASANFDEITPGNGMKYSSCVAKDGTMSFSEVTKFIEMAKSAGLSIYGHTLAWHSQQQNEYLKSLIADKEIKVDPNNAEHALHIKLRKLKQMFGIGKSIILCLQLSL